MLVAQLRLLRFMLLVLLCCASATTTYAWNRAGHMVTGVIAYKDLQASDKQALQRVVALLQSHPDYPKWQGQIESLQLSGANADIYLFALAARWADDVRGSSSDHQSWHYINFPFVPPGQSGITAPSPAAENILKAYETNLAVLHSNASDAERAIAACWLFHLIGDVHQPLHTSGLFSADYPKGDRGGNAIYVRVKPDTATINLHSFWDDLILGSDRFQSVTNRATGLHMFLPRRILVELKTKSFAEWAQESFRLATKAAYRNGAIKGGPSRDEGVVLPDDYIAVTKPIAERRVVLAGYRLADLLRSPPTSGGGESRGPATGSATLAATSRIIGNRNSRVYHLPHCPAYQQVSEKNRVYFETEAEARGAGFRRAGNCR